MIDQSAAHLPATDSAAVHRSSESPISMAILVAMAMMPMVVAAGFLTGGADGASTAPADVSILALRGGFDADPARDQGGPARAGF